MQREPRAFEQPKRNIRELVDAQIPLERTPAADLLAFQVERNIDEARRERPDALPQVHALMTAFRMLDIPMYNRLSGQPWFGPKPYERVDTFEDMARRRSEIMSGIMKAARALEEDPTNKMQFENAWMYVTRNKRGDTAYRVYLSPNAEDVGEIFLDIAKSVPRDLGFQMKTFDDQAGSTELARNDKIILYGSEQEIDRLFETVRQVYARHQSAFHGRITPPGGLPTEMIGVGVARQSDQDSQTGKKTGTEVIAETVDARILSRGSATVKRRYIALRQNLSEVSNRDEGRFLCASMTKIAEKNKWHSHKKWPSEQERFSEDIRKEVNDAYARAVFRQTARALATETSISMRACKETMMEELKSVKLTPAQRMAFQNEETIGGMMMFGVDEKTLISKALQVTGLAMTLHEGISRGQTPGDAFRNFLKE